MCYTSTVQEEVITIISKYPSFSFLERLGFFFSQFSIFLENRGNDKLELNPTA
uniref:Uncharacterized protein n=1 Tax=Siphoviridae sp. ctr2f5 TaxID=2825684 RepID=A0A8S5QF59_9CAUD|nr:MAG TPA: hypothetical protein [Siphoviridae sp. ctr2f5]